MEILIAVFTYIVIGVVCAFAFKPIHTLVFEDEDYDEEKMSLVTFFWPIFAFFYCLIGPLKLFIWVYSKVLKKN
ncbi:hypothetical protein AVV36_gp093 [Pectobacterium bacteriophage PM2]|uniref:Uncharacterized protein n=1 Tax=Pectobacterium bacteriophage PM2 TaxID=1429794 RepID=A0A0A0Q2E5_9CAUD|nr:hypothetical protein AVV36_gp093 [Pectobacterium bacteriophage PM2]AHY25055.1 hypothetical protein PM2_093 [Pectobacterium bacteriophage PM2]